jgi:translocation and assembly module TamB
MNTPEYQIYASPNLAISIIPPTFRLTGTVDIPKARLAPADLTSTVTLPPETIIIGGPEHKRIESRWKVYQDINVTLGKDVTVDGMGLTGRLTGQVSLSGQPDSNILGTGHINIQNGSYNASGRILTLSNDSGITFTQSPLINPTLNIQASRKIKALPSSSKEPSSQLQDYLVGIDIQGTLDDPNFSLFSTPGTLSQADILSFLLFDQPSNANTPGNVGLLLQALNHFKLGGASTGGVESEISQTLGLTEFGVQSQASIDALGTPIAMDFSSFVVGRYISPSIYVRYSRGLSMPINIFQMRYLFGKNWAIQTESGSLGSGADILYSFERK